MGSAIEDYFSTKEQMFTEVLLLETSKVYSAHPVGTKIFNQNTLQSRFPFIFFFSETLHAQLEWTSVPIEIYGCFNGNSFIPEMHNPNNTLCISLICLTSFTCLCERHFMTGKRDYLLLIFSFPQDFPKADTCVILTFAFVLYNPSSMWNSPLV